MMEITCGRVNPWVFTLGCVAVEFEDVDDVGVGAEALKALRALADAVAWLIIVVVSLIYYDVTSL